MSNSNCISWDEIEKELFSEEELAELNEEVRKGLIKIEKRKKREDVVNKFLKSIQSKVAL